MNDLQKAGGIAALYIALAYSAAIPYFLVVVDYPGVVDPGQKVELLRQHYASMYAMHLLVYELVGIALIVLGVALYDRLKGGAPRLAQLALVLGVTWSCLLLASSMVFNYGMGIVVDRFPTDPVQAVWMWQVIEGVAQGLGGAGGELLGALWMLAVSGAAHHASRLPRAMIYFGVVIAGAGFVSNVPPLRDAAVVFGLLQIVWFAWIAAFLLRQKGSDGRPA